MLRTFVAATVLIASASLIGCQTAKQPAPLPENISIQDAPASLSEKHAAFLGRWHGRWGGTLDGYLVVTSMTPPTAEVIYAWGTNQYVKEPGWIKRTATLDGDSLIVPITDDGERKAVYTMNGDGTLAGVYTRPGVRSDAVLMCETC